MDESRAGLSRHELPAQRQPLTVEVQGRGRQKVREGVSEQVTGATAEGGAEVNWPSGKGGAEGRGRREGCLLRVSMS